MTFCCLFARHHASYLHTHTFTHVGELLKLVRDLRRAISNPVHNAAGVVRELENILAVVPSGRRDA